MTSRPYLSALFFTIGCLLTLFIAGCRTAQTPVIYYNLTPLATERHQPNLTAAHKSLAIGIMPVLFPDALDQARIAYRLDPQRLKYTDSHRWSSALADDFTKVLMENITVQLPEQTTIAFFPWGSFFQPTHRLILDVSRFDGKPGDEVVLSARWTITNASGKETLLSRKSTIRVKTTGNDYPELVTALSQAVADLSGEIALLLLSEFHKPAGTD